MDQREASIVAQVAAKVAGSIYAAQIASAGEVDEFGAIAGTVMDTIVTLTAQYAVQEAFPGTQQAPQPQSQFPAGGMFPAQGQTAPQTNFPPNVAQFPQQPGMAPAGVPGQAFDKWADFRQNYGNWEDRRAQKAGNPKKPDFVHRFQPDAKNPQYKVSIYLANDDTPYDIKQAFGLVQ